MTDTAPDLPARLLRRAERIVRARAVDDDDAADLLEKLGLIAPPTPEQTAAREHDDELARLHQWMFENGYLREVSQ